MVMSQEHSDGEDSVVETGTDRFVDATVETEVELRLPLEVDMEPDWIRKVIPIYLGAVGLDVTGPDPETRSRLEPRTGPDRDYGYPALRNPVGSDRGGGIAGRVRRRSVHIRNNQPNISGAGPTPTKC